ncbi:auxin-responsive protein SAUR32-like [Juglans microcarpa x Juglans regia]|uniref:auxin-responsive protein SAUR32-like n=1 Tax=Juglans microcarpa x Juglans regia TaxID=2249226 RepID=UPI001B7EA6F8|nr:auxin-responsive protein SAUR32-like [Juglans microcarpa x Juglans regia]
MSNIPRSLTDSSLTLFNLAISASDPCNQNRNHLNFHIHMPHLHFQHQRLHEKKELKDIPKGCLAILVGQGEEQERFVIPVIYINHPLFIQLLKEAEEEFGFDQKGPITIPCHVEEFRTVQGMIDGEKWHHQHHHHHHVWCFRV